MTESRQLRVFLCHSSQDKLIVRELYQRLLTEGWIDPWLDEEKLLPGQDWDMEIEKAVEAADVVIVFLSNNSITKEGYVQKELRKVLDVSDEKPEGTIFIIPIRINELQIPRRLKLWQYVDLFPAAQIRASFVRIIASLKKRADDVSISTHTIPSLDDDIAVRITVMDKWENVVHNGYFLTKPNAVVGDILTNFKNEYPESLSDDVYDYAIDLELSLNDPVNNIDITNESILTIRPRQDT